MKPGDSEVDHPAHYGGAENLYETIKVMEAWYGRERTADFCIMNAVKYLSRAGKKGGPASVAVDLEKAAWYATYAAKLLSLR